MPKIQANQWKAQSHLRANGRRPQPWTTNGIQLLPPGVRPRLPEPVRCRGCPGQGATWSGFLVRRARPPGTWNAMGGNGPHCLVTMVCKRQTLSECGSTLFPPRLGVDFSPPRLPPGSQERAKHRYLPQMLPGRYLVFLLTAQRDWCCSFLCFMNGLLQSSERLSHLPKTTWLESGRAWT